MERPGDNEGHQIPICLKMLNVKMKTLKPTCGDREISELKIFQNQCKNLVICACSVVMEKGIKKVMTRDTGADVAKLCVASFEVVLSVVRTVRTAQSRELHSHVSGSQ